MSSKISTEASVHHWRGESDTLMGRMNSHAEFEELEQD